MSRFSRPLSDGLNEPRDDPIELVYLGLKMTEMTANISGQFFPHDIEAILLHGTHHNELTSPGHQILNRLNRESMLMTRDESGKVAVMENNYPLERPACQIGLFLQLR